MKLPEPLKWTLDDALQQRFPTLNGTQIMSRDLYHGYHLGHPYMFEAPDVYTNTSPDLVYGPYGSVLPNSNMGLEYWSGPMLTMNAALDDAGRRAAMMKLSEFLSALRKSFSPRNFSREVVQRQADCVVGREPDWVIENVPAEASEWAKRWWKRSGAHQKLLAAAYQASAEGRAALQIGPKPGALNDQGQLRSKDSAALERLLAVTILPPESLLTGEDEKADPWAVQRVVDGGERRAQLACLTDDGMTLIRAWTGEGAEPMDVQAKLGGRLPMAELTSPPILTDTFMANQRAWNTASTMMSRNTELAGWVERYAINLNPPMVRDGQGNEVPLLSTGPGAMSLWYSKVNAVEQDDGSVKPSYAPSPEYGRMEPVSPEPIRLAAEHAEQAMLGEARQTHTLLNKDGSANARSREVAAADFTNSLMPLERALNDTGAWLVETAIAMYGHFIGQDYSAVQVDFRCRVQPVPPTVAERQQAMAEAEVGTISLSNQRSQIGILDSAAEDAQIQKERAAGTSPTLIPSKVAGGSTKGLLAALDTEQKAQQIAGADMANPTGGTD